MSTHKAMPLAALILSALILAAALATPGEAAAPKAADPFEKLKGDWKGGGMVVPSDGEPKKVSCKVTYKVAGRTTTQHLRCAGNDYSINATNKMTDKDGKIRGSWNESTYDVNGGVTGTARDDTIHARISGDKFSSRMSIKISDTGHSINIVQLNEKSGTYRLVASLLFHR
jgi:hypothetical protein